MGMGAFRGPISDSRHRPHKATPGLGEKPDNTKKYGTVLFPSENYPESGIKELYGKTAAIV